MAGALACRGNLGLDLQESNAIRPPLCGASFQISFLTKQRQQVRDSSRRLLVKHTYKQGAEPRPWAQRLPLDCSAFPGPGH